MKPILFLSGLFSRKPKRTQLTPLPSRTERAGYSIAYWQRQPDLVQGAINLQATPEFKQMMQVLHQHIPRGFPMRGEPATDTQVNVEHGRTEGYLDCLQLIEALTRHAPKPAEQIESTFGAEKGDYQ